MMTQKLNSVLGITLVIALLLSCRTKVKENSVVEKKHQISVDYTDSLELIFEKEYAKGHLPGFALSIFTADSIHFMKGYGYADLAEKRPFDENTIQGIASISKTLIAIALMKAVEEGKMTLNDEINTILPYKVTNPNFPNIPITLRHLATHTSSISDDEHYDKAYVFSEDLKEEEFSEAWSKYIKLYNDNTSMTMESYFYKMFASDGDWVSNNNFYPHQPGSTYEYSNIGAALLAYCIQLKIGKNYKEYTKDLILEPLGMNSSGWEYNNEEKERHIIYYNESKNPVPPYEVITYPDGGLFSSVADMTTYMQDMMKGHAGNGQLLTPSSYQTMMANQIPALDTPTGIIWDMDNTCCIGHGGNDFGIATMAFFNPDTGIGKVLFSNISLEKEELGDQFYSIFNSMFRYDNVLSSAK